MGGCLGKEDYNQREQYWEAKSPSKRKSDRGNDVEEEEKDLKNNHRPVPLKLIIHYMLTKKIKINFKKD